MPMDGKKSPNKASIQDLSILMGKIFLSKSSVCAADELSGLKPGTFPGSGFVVGLNNATAPRGAGCHSPRISIGCAGSVLGEERRI